MHNENIINQLLSLIEFQDYKLHKFSIICSEDVLKTRLHQDINNGIREDNWSEINYNSYYTASYQASHMGIMLDNNIKTKNVFTTVFTSPKVLNELSERNVKDALLFTHHPMSWDMTKNPIVEDISEFHLQFLKENRISVYNLHTPLDRVSGYSTSVTLARVFGANIIDVFLENHGCYAAVIAQVPYKTININEFVEIQYQFLTFFDVDS